MDVGPIKTLQWMSLPGDWPGVSPHPCMAHRRRRILIVRWLIDFKSGRWWSAETLTGFSLRNLEVYIIGGGGGGWGGECLREAITCRVASMYSKLSLHLSLGAGVTSWALYDIPWDSRKWATLKSGMASAMNKSLLAKRYASLCVVRWNDYEINV